MRPPRRPVQFSILKSGLDILDIDTQKITKPHKCFLERSYAVLIELKGTLMQI